MQQFDLQGNLYNLQIENEKKMLTNNYNTKREEYYNKLQSNWNSLREFINEWIENLENQRESIEGTDLFENHTLVILDDIKIRMNELEGKDKE